MTRRTRVDPTTTDGPATGEPCYECPFRTTNEHKQLTHEVDGVNEFAKIWWEISREGRTYGCHMAQRECAGTVNMITAELTKLQQSGSWEKYHQDNPLGLSETVIPHFLDKTRGRFLGSIPVADPQSIILTILASHRENKS